MIPSRPPGPLDGLDSALADGVSDFAVRSVEARARQALRAFLLARCGSPDAVLSEVEALAYADDDGAMKIAVVAAVLDDHECPDPELPGDFLRTLVKAVLDVDLDGIVNDVSVGHEQWRDGAYVSRSLIPGDEVPHLLAE